MDRVVKHDKRKIVWVADGTTKDFPGRNIVSVPKEIQESNSQIIQRYQVKDNAVCRRSVGRKGLRCAFVSPYGIECGISTYSEWLWKAIGSRVGDYRIFAERADCFADEENKIKRCWTRGQPLTELLSQIIAYDPDVVFIQHEYGIFNNARYWMAFISGLGNTPSFITLHSVYAHTDKVICEAPIKNAIVHTELARDCLIQKGFTGKVHVIPHGCLEPQPKKNLFDFYKSKHTLLQFGFGFRYKGWELALETVSILKKSLPDIFFTGIFSTPAYSTTELDQYYDEILELINKLDIRENVAIIRGFMQQNVLATYLRMNKVALFPYQQKPGHEAFGCSGAARIAMAYGVPIVTSDAPLFHDLRAVAPRAVDAESLASIVSTLFIKDMARIQVKTQDKFLTDNSWDITAERYLNCVD